MAFIQSCLNYLSVVMIQDREFLVSLVAKGGGAKQGYTPLKIAKGMQGMHRYDGKKKVLIKKLNVF